MNIRLTPAQQLILNAVLSMMVSALTAAGAAAFQSFQSGTINLWACLSLFLATFFSLFGHALYVYVPAHVSDELQAVKDTQAQLENSHNAALLALNNAFSTIAQINTSKPVAATQSVSASPLVVIHAQQASAQPASDTAAALVQPTPKVAPAQASPVENVPPITYRGNNASGSTVVMSDDLLGDLPATNGNPVEVAQITGRIPTYGTSGQ